MKTYKIETKTFYSVELSVNDLADTIYKDDELITLGEIHDKMKRYNGFSLEELEEIARIKGFDGVQNVGYGKENKWRCVFYKHGDTTNE